MLSAWVVEALPSKLVEAIPLKLSAEAVSHQSKGRKGQEHHNSLNYTANRAHA